MIWTSPKTWVAYAKLTAAELNTHLRDNLLFLKANTALGEPEEVEIDAGIATVTQSYVAVDTEAEAPTDDLETISGVSEGQIVIVRAYHEDRTVVLKDGGGNLLLGTDIPLDNTAKLVALFCDQNGNLNLIATSPRVLANSGTGTIAAAATSVKIEHGLSAIPTGVLITLTSSLGPASEIYVSNKDPDTDGEKFEVTVDNAPDADVTFDWRAWIGKGN